MFTAGFVGVAVCVLAHFLVSACSPLEGAMEYDVFFVAGQSNACGRVLTSDAATPSYIDTDTLLDSSNAAIKVWTGAAITDYVIGTNGASGNGKYFVSGDNTKNWSQVHVALHLISARTENPVLVVQVTEGGTMLSPLPRATDNKGSWSPRFEEIFAGGDPLLLRLKERYDSLKTYAAAHSITLNPRALIWHQGEADYDVSINASLTVVQRQSALDSYEADLASLVSYVRTEIAGEPIPVFSGTVPAASSKYSAEIRAAMLSFAASDPAAYWMDTDSLSLFDGLHFSAAANLTFGQWIAGTWSIAMTSYNSTAALLHMDGANNGTVFDDWSPVSPSIVRAGSVLPRTSTAQSKFYGSSGEFPANASGQPAHLRVTVSQAPGTGPFFIQGWIYPTVNNTAHNIAEGRIESGFSGVSGVVPGFRINRTGSNEAYFEIINGSGGSKIISGSEIAVYDWSFVLAGRNSDHTMRLFLGGVLVGSDTCDYNLTNSEIAIGGAPIALNREQMFLQDVRIVIGADGPTENFTPPTRLIGTISNAAVGAGKILDRNGNPASRKIFAVPRSYLGANRVGRIFSGESDANGDFSIQAPAGVEHSVIALSEGTPAKNDQILRVIPT